MVWSEWQNLNGLWDYAITDSTTFRPNNFDGKILVPYPIESALSGVKRALLPGQKLWYQRSIEVKEKQKDKKYLLHFGAVDYRASVYVNGKQVGEHTGGYQEFTLDISDALQTGKNDLIVAVLDPTDQGNSPKGKQVLKPEGIMYTASSGIWQTVWLETVPAEYIDHLQLTPDVDNSNLRILVNVTKNSKDYTVEAGSGGSVIKGDANKEMLLKISNARLWSPDDPFLYDITIKLLYNGKVADEVKSYFGMRKIEIKKDSLGQKRIFLNNKYTFNLGVLDQGFWPDGLYTAPTDEGF
jgi:beta-galactosidase/beta-glucuronidase